MGGYTDCMKVAQDSDLPELSRPRPHPPRASQEDASCSHSQTRRHLGKRRLKARFQLQRLPSLSSSTCLTPFSPILHSSWRRSANSLAKLFRGTPGPEDKPKVLNMAEQWGRALPISQPRLPMLSLTPARAPLAQGLRLCISPPHPSPHGQLLQVSENACFLREAFPDPQDEARSPRHTLSKSPVPLFRACMLSRICKRSCPLQVAFKSHDSDGHRSPHSI